MKAPSQERLKLLHELSADTLLKEEAILSRVPDWGRLEKAGLIPPGSSHSLASLQKGTLRDATGIIVADPDVSLTLLKVLAVEGDLQPIEYLLTLYYDVIRDDASAVDAMISAYRDVDVFTPFNNLLERPKLDTFTADKGAFLLSSLITRAPYKRIFSDEHIQYFIQSTVRGSYLFSEAGRLDVLKNILKNDHFRESVWSTRGSVDLILASLDVKKAASLYPAVFSVWLLTFNHKFLVPFLEAGAVEKVCSILKETKIEKVVRVCIHTILNFLSDDLCVEAVIQQEAVHTLTLLEYEKWRDEEMYVEIRDGLAALQQKIRQFSNFDRYCRELDTGVLKWSYLHSEKFWHENVNQFEDKEFAAIKKLSLLLRSDDPPTLSVVCHDLGEFTRLYPTGKKVIQKMKLKEAVMMLMPHKDREVAREALLCVQKMMLDRWQDAAAAS